MKPTRPQHGEDDLISTSQAADLLGVRKQTIYAYVSRGLLERVGGTTRHSGSTFRRSQVQALARRHHRPRAGTFELSIDTSITYLDPSGRLLFRGRDAVDLAYHSDFETTAELLWRAPTGDWAAGPIARDVAARASRAAVSGSAPARIRLACEIASDSMEVDTVAHGDEARSARILIVSAVQSLLPERAWSRPGKPLGIAERLWSALADRAPRHDEIEVLRAALVLLADHELATSSIATRAAASTGASIGHAVSAGLAAMAGARHGRASLLSERLLSRATEIGPCAALDAIDAAPAGFGHTVYRDVDPRAEHLLDRLSTLGSPTAPLVEELALEVLRRWRLVPNVDLALAAIVRELGLPSGAGEVVFMVSRMAGLAAHAMEERGQPMRFRPRAVYTGEQPSPD